MTEPSPAHARIATLFCVLHDGVIAHVEREPHASALGRKEAHDDPSSASERVRTSLVLTVHIGYLAERITPGARDLRVTLREVRNLRYFPWADPGEASRPAVPADEVLGGEVDVLEGEVDAEGEVVVRILRHGACASDVGGELRFSADDVTVHDERGVVHTVEELMAVARGTGRRGRRGLHEGVTVPSYGARCPRGMGSARWESGSRLDIPFSCAHRDEAELLGEEGDGHERLALGGREAVGDAHGVEDPPDALSCAGGEEWCAFAESAYSGVAHRAARGS